MHVIQFKHQDCISERLTIPAIPNTAVQRVGLNPKVTEHFIEFIPVIVYKLILLWNNLSPHRPRPRSTRGRGQIIETKAKRSKQPEAKAEPS